MKVVATFPGRHGDLLWALPSLRAIWQATGEPVSLGLSPKYSSLASLIRQQPYIAECFPIQGWEVQETAPMTPWEAPPYCELVYDKVIHLGYRGWPDQPLPYCTYSTLTREYPDIPVAPLDLETPWIAPQPFGGYPVPSIVAGWSDEWIELKAGVSVAIGKSLCAHGREHLWVIGGDRIQEFRGLDDIPDVTVYSATWDDAVRAIGVARVFLGCCSALHVLACALGRRCLIVEPSTMRHHNCFYPYGMDGPRVTIVRGNDGQPSFDARHTREYLERLLKEVQP